MSIASELSALNGYILGAYDEVDNKGGTVPANKNMANLASAIASISGGGGSGNVAYGTITTNGESSYVIQHGLNVVPKLFVCASSNVNSYTGSSNNYGSKFYICFTHLSADRNGLLCQVMGSNSVSYFGSISDAQLASNTIGNGFFFLMDSTTATIKSGISSSNNLGTNQTYYWCAVGDFSS